MNAVIVDDYELIRDLLRTCCSSISDLKVAGEAGSGEDAVQMVLRTQPDLLLLDLNLPDFSGFRVLRTLLQANSMPRRVLILSGYCNDLVVFLTECAHVHGFLVKSAVSVHTLRHAIGQVARGGMYWSRQFTEIREARHKNSIAFDKLLSEREVLVLALCGSLLSDSEIADHLNISFHTVLKHRANIGRKLNFNTRLDMIKYAHSHGFCETRMLP